MSTETKRLVETYMDWLRERASEREIGAGWSELTLPFLDRHNDYLQVYVRQGHDGLHITDEGRTIQDLKRVGCELKASAKRRAIAEEILRGLGLDPDILDDGEIKTAAVNGDFPRKLHHMLLSMLAIDGLANVSSPNVTAIFKEDVADWLRDVRAPFETGVRLTGRTGAEYKFDFHIPPKDSNRGKVLQAIAEPDRMHVQSFTYEVIDTRDGLGNDSPDFFAILNRKPTKKPYDTLLKNEITPVTWANRDEHRRKFAS